MSNHKSGVAKTPFTAPGPRRDPAKNVKINPTQGVLGKRRLRVEMKGRERRSLILMITGVLIGRIQHPLGISSLPLVGGQLEPNIL